MSPTAPPRALLLMGDDRERLLALAARALGHGFAVTLTHDPGARLDGYAGVAVSFGPGSARELAAERLVGAAAAAVLLQDETVEEGWARLLAMTRDVTPAVGPEGRCVVVSTFRVANGMSSDVARAFRDRPRRVDAYPGFRDLEVLCPDEDPDEFWLLTSWTDVQSFRQWHHSHRYREAHAGIPRGLRLDPSATRVRTFRSIAR